MDTIIAENSHDLLKLLGGTDISVPSRTEGRITKHCERWSICRFLATFARTELIHYPCETVHEDKPDFVLSSPTCRYGIEVTEVVPPNAAAIDALREHKEIDGPFFLQAYSPGEPKLKGEKLRAKALSTEPGDVWAGGSAEKEWGAAMQYRIHEKVATASKDEFRLFQRNWLLMYDNWYLPAVNLEKAAKSLFCSMESESYGPFEYVFIESSSRIWVFGPAYLSSEPVNDLWQNS